MSGLGRCPLCSNEVTTGHTCSCCPGCREASTSFDALAQLSANQSAAVLGHLQPGHMYPGKPAVPVEEALRLRRALVHLARRALVAEYRGRCDVTDQDVNEAIAVAEKLAAKEIPIVYAQEAE